MSLLELEGLDVAYGRIQALRRDHARRSSEGEIVALIGANGAGKTTTMKTISGLRPAAAGADDASTGRTSPRSGPTCGSRAGYRQSPEGRGIFPGMTVRGEPRHGRLRAHATPRRRSTTTWSGSSPLPAAGGAARPGRRHASGGEQQMLAIGRALMARPGCCCSTSRRMGLAPQLITADLRHHRGDQPAGRDGPAGRAERQQALGLAHRAYVLETGEVTRSGPGSELLADPSIQDAYLGVAAGAAHPVGRLRGPEWGVPSWVASARSSCPRSTRHRPRALVRRQLSGRPRVAPGQPPAVHSASPALRSAACSRGRGR